MEVALRGPLRVGWGEKHGGTPIPWLNSSGGTLVQRAMASNGRYAEWKKPSRSRRSDEEIRPTGLPRRIQTEPGHDAKNGRAAMWIDAQSAGGMQRTEAVKVVGQDRDAACHRIEATPNGYHWLWSWAIGMQSRLKQPEEAQKICRLGYLKRVHPHWLADDLGGAKYRRYPQNRLSIILIIRKPLRLPGGPLQGHA